MSLTTKQAAEALGMKVREIVDVERVDGEYVVTTHDGQRTSLGRDGQWVAPAGAAAAAASESEAQASAPARPEPPAKSAGKPEWVKHAIASGMTAAQAEAMTKPELIAKTGGMPPAADEVPDGTPEEILAWVGNDKDRAVAALLWAADRDEPRDGLTDELEKLAGGSPA